MTKAPGLPAGRNIAKTNSRIKRVDPHNPQFAIFALYL